MTPEDLKLHYGEDDFGGLTDDLLARAIARASSTINRYIPTPPSTLGDVDRITSVWLTLARAYAYDDQSLPAEHPVVRELQEALSWLKAVGTGSIEFGEVIVATAQQAMAAPRVSAPAAVFGDDFAAMQPVVRSRRRVG